LRIGFLDRDAVEAMTVLELFRRQTTLAREIVKDEIHPGDRVIDGTAGNGSDTLFLARCVGDAGHVYAFDIQKEAIESTRKKLSEAGLMGRVSLFNQSHEDMEAVTEIADGSPMAAIVFNLGYLPGGSKEVTTRADATLKAVTSALHLLGAGGVLTICAYAHEEGRREIDALRKLFATLDHAFDVYEVTVTNHTQAPVLFIVRKKR